MAKPKLYYLCQECGYKTSKWLGRCPECQSWNSFVEEVETKDKHSGSLLQSASSGSRRPTPLNEIAYREDDRAQSGIPEFDRVSGGLIAGQAILISGEPGIGKSTLLLQVADRLSGAKRSVLYVNGEESNSQIKRRAERLGVNSEQLFLYADNNLENVLQRVRDQKPGVLFIDSLQTVFLPRFDSLPGSVVQVRECAYELVQLCKAEEIPLFLVSHITKTGNIAGPKIVEHIVDTVLFLSADNRGIYRLLRSQKNRFYRTDELGMFRMTEKGMEGIDDAVTAFTWQHEKPVSGTVVYPFLEGNRVFPVEVQALCSPTQFNNPRRAADGIDQNRLLMLIAILEKRLRLDLFPFDIYLNITGGLRINDPALDLAVLFALYSSFKDIAVSQEMTVVAEVGLTGEVRPVPGIAKRIRESFRQGAKSIVVPYSQEKLERIEGCSIYPVKTLDEAIRLIG